MDLTTVIVTGIAAGGFGVGGMLVGLRLALPSLMVRIEDEIDGYILQLPDRFKSDPELTKKLVEPFIAAGMASLGVSKTPKDAGSIKVGGFKIPSELVTMGINILGGGMKQTAEKAVTSLVG